ncbi:MAG: PDZ domain-containing protein, partial [Armatimonadetes bacterium]|nr:PDZ domain-containing protein [Armatimonadota bacterium]
MRAGQFGGVGMELGIRDERLTVVAPLKDTPAFRAGILAGDKIVKINGEDATNLSIESAVSLIRGRPGTQVTITITREGLAKPRDITLTRENIKIPTVEVEYLGYNKEIAHLSIYSFNSNVDDDFKKA